jgi:hypothetical protein
LSFSPILPQRKQVRRPVVNTPEEVFVHIVQDLVDFSLTEIEHPLDLIPETPTGDISEPDNFLKEEEFNLGSEGMEGNNDHHEERGNPPHNN